MSEGIIIALIGSITSITTLVVTSITNYKVRKQQNLRQEISAEIKDLKTTINGNRRKTLKNILVNEFTQLINGEEKSKEQLQDIAEMFEEYKTLGGNSYIDDLHDIWKAKQIKK